MGNFALTTSLATNLGGVGTTGGTTEGVIDSKNSFTDSLNRLTS